MIYVGLQPHNTHWDKLCTCFLVDSYFNHWNSSSHFGQNLCFFTWASSPRSVSLSGFHLSGFLNVEGLTISNKLFCVEMTRQLTIEMAAQSTYHDDRRDFWVGPTRPSFLTSQNFFSCVPRMHFTKKLSVCFIFCAYNMHTYALMGTLYMWSDHLQVLNKKKYH